MYRFYQQQEIVVTIEEWKSGCQNWEVFLSTINWNYHFEIASNTYYFIFFELLLNPEGYPGLPAKLSILDVCGRHGNTSGICLLAPRVIGSFRWKHFFCTNCFSTIMDNWNKPFKAVYFLEFTIGYISRWFLWKPKRCDWSKVERNTKHDWGGNSVNRV